MAANAPSQPKMHRYTFPPFPNAPEDTIPFKDYKENGLKIQDDGEEGPEVDGLGNSSVPLRSHSDDFCKTNAGRRHTKNPVPETPDRDAAPGSDVPRRTWLEIWEDLGRQRSGESYNEQNLPADRLHQATRAYNRGRTWPTRDRHIREQWDQWQLFIGILSITPVWRPKQEQKDVENDDDADDYDDDLLETPPDDSKNGSVREVATSTERDERARDYKKKPRPRPPYENYHKEPVVVDGSEDIQQLLDQSREDKTDRTIMFLNNPARSIQVYLSSYMRKQGFHYEERNLTLLPRLIRFYVEFLIKDGVFNFPGEKNSIEKSLKNSLSILDVAQIELPLTSQITKRFPWNDTFSEACDALFGISVKERDFWNQAWSDNNVDASLRLEHEPSVEVSSTAAATTASTPVRRNATLPELDVDIKASDALETPVQGISVEFTGNSSMVDPALAPLSAVESDEGIALDDTIDKATPAVGAAGGSSWEQTDSASAGWGKIDFDVTNDDPWGTSSDTEWLVDDKPKTLFHIFGPTALPLTHETGIIEWSMRKIQSIVHPDAAPKSIGVPHELGIISGPSAEKVEADLSSRLSRIVLEPWLDWESRSEEGDSAVPQIKALSRGRVVVYEYKDEKNPRVIYENGADVRSNALAAPDDGNTILPPAHDPLHHSITILVDPDSAKLLRKGMGMGGTWVQMARLADLRNEETEGKMTSETGDVNTDAEGGDKSKGQRLWYLSNLLAVLPSYHIASY